MNKTTDRTTAPAGIWHLLAMLVAAAALSVCPAAAQDVPTGQLSGVVTAAGTGEPLAGAIVNIEDLNLRIRTDVEGRFTFTGLVIGRHTLSVRMLGRLAIRRPFDIGPGSSARLDVALQANVVTLPAIEVLRRRTELAYGLDDIPGSVHVISGADLDRGNPFHDVHQALRKVPGVNVQEEDGFGLRPNIGIRGTGSERSAKITLMEDGILIAPAPYAAPAAYYFPVLGVMEALEVRKGSSQIKYGPRTTGGVLNLVSAPIPDALRLTADVAGGQNATGRVNASIGDSYDNFGWLAQAYGIRSNGFKELAEGSTGFDVQSYNLKLRLSSDPDADVYQEVQLKLGYNVEESDETYLGLTDADFDLKPNRRYSGSQIDVMNAAHRQASLRHFVRPGGRFDLTTTAYRNEFDRNWFKLQSVEGQSISRVLARATDFDSELAVLRGATSRPDALRVRANNRAYVSQGVQTVIGFQAGASVHHEFEVGARYHEDQEDRFQHEDAFQMVAGRMILTTPGSPGSQSNRIGHARALALFVQDEVTIADWTITPGLRYEHIDLIRTDYATDDPGRTAPTRQRDTRVNVLIPGIGASYAFRPDMRVFAGVHRGFAPPGPGADGTTEAEVSVNYETGVRFSAGGLNAQAVGFFNDYSNLLGTATLATGEDGSGDQFNGGAVTVGGVELSVDYDPKAGANRSITFPAVLAFTYTRTEFQTAFESDYESWGSVQRGDELPYVARAQGHASFGVRHWRWSVNLAASYSAAMRTAAGSGPMIHDERTDAFVVLDGSADYKLTPRTSFYVSVKNITNEAYIVARRPAGVRPGLPRMVLGGVTISR